MEKLRGLVEKGNEEVKCSLWIVKSMTKIIRGS
jgi:hypothetical protein